jgi:hypothetical protein
LIERRELLIEGPAKLGLQIVQGHRGYYPTNLTVTVT